MIYEVPLFGPPLAGKSSLLDAAAFASGVPVRTVEATLRTSDAFNGASVRLFEAKFTHTSDILGLWCLPGGCAPDWPVQFVGRPDAAIFVADTQSSRHAENAVFWSTVRDVVGSDDWFVVLTKCDLTNGDEQANALPVELRARPSLRVASHDAVAVRDAARAFLDRVVFPSIVG
jgi:hypothetical protein